MNGENSHLVMLLFNSVCLQTREDNSGGSMLRRVCTRELRNHILKINYNLRLKKGGGKEFFGKHIFCFGAFLLSQFSLLDSWV